jgi:hypothetical protein
MAAVVAEFVGSSVTASDIFDDGYGIAPVDFLNDPHLVCPAWIITNPPFSTACAFSLRALDLATEAWPCWCARNGSKALVGMKTCSVIGRHHSMRPFRARSDGQGTVEPARTTATSFAWFVWGKALSGPSRVFWIPPGCRGSLTLPNDRQRFAALSFTPADAPLLDRIEITP